MKKLLFIALASLLFGSVQEARAGKHDIIDGGPYILTGAFLPGVNYNYPESVSNTSGYTFKGITFQFGHNFLIAEMAPVSISMRATWVELAGGIDNNPNSKFYVFHGSLIKLGPEFSFELSRNMAIDGYAQISPTISVLGEFGNNNARSAVGLTGSIGAAFRYKKMTFAAETAMGRLLDNDARGSGPYVGWTDAQKENLKYRSSNIKLMIGLQFGKG